jgi:hypothetical protein
MDQRRVLTLEDLLAAVVAPPADDPVEVAAADFAIARVFSPTVRIFNTMVERADRRALEAKNAASRAVDHVTRRPRLLRATATALRSCRRAPRRVAPARMDRLTALPIAAHAPRTRDLTRSIREVASV